MGNNATAFWDAYTPFSLGFDETFNRLEALAGAGSNYPPYNVINRSDGRTSVEVALAGFSRDDIEVATERNVLTIKARSSSKENKQYQHRGIASRSFERGWQLGDGVEVQDVQFENGLLTVTLEKHIPEELKKKLSFGKELKTLSAS